MNAELWVAYNGAGLRDSKENDDGNVCRAYEVYRPGNRNAKDLPTRAEAFKQMAKTLGATVKELFWTQGRYDIVTIVEAPDEISATALNLSISALGNVRTESLRAFSPA